jgi:pimeloyl-ACP methyl ester carboxylesterase
MTRPPRQSERRSGGVHRLSAPMFEAARDLARFRAAYPQLITAQTLGSGHFSQLEVPDQINAMVERFLAVGIERPAF